MPGNFVTFRRLTDMACMEMAGEKHIGPATGKFPHGHARPPHNVSIVMSFRQIERMMGDQNLDDAGTTRAEFLPNPSHLTLVDAAAFDCQRSSCVYPNYRDLIIGVEGPQVVRDVATILLQRVREPREHIVQGDVVIPGHNYLGFGQRVEKRASLFELVRARALRKVSGNGDDVGFQIVDSSGEWRDDRFVDSAEVNVR